MMASEVHSTLIVRKGKILMTFHEERKVWSIPHGECEKGELGADTAERIAEEFTNCPSEVTKYRKRLKTKLDDTEEKIVWQPYQVEIEGEPEKGEWVPLKELEEKELSSHISGIKEKIVKRL